ncbi:YdcF family protein [Neokomagataea anthophila]|uniref:YdcF family protein n=1 Tax=Neokomagataea anthophila TaxID=2826925 RepID=A0ABS5E564_9PROT|nr:YdcF family protein [Neokomagataea anthophila]MBR0559046.1 YdcF family protein [Neokomagataea anthophila]
MKTAFRLLCCLFLLLGLGFIIFVADACRPPPSAIPQADAIIALTGGEKRVNTAIDLLRSGYAHTLFISGVAPHVTLTKLIAAPGVYQSDLPAELSTHIILGRRAYTTIGNAHETAEWAHAQHAQHLILVTAGYHIRRATIELHRTAPDLIITPYPVQPSALQSLLSRSSFHLLAREYLKLLGAECGFLTGLPDGKDGLRHSSTDTLTAPQ